MYRAPRTFRTNLDVRRRGVMRGDLPDTGSRWERLLRRLGLEIPPGFRHWATMLPFVAIAGSLLVLALGSYYQVEPAEVGAVQRFGRLVRTTQPGPHFKIPLGIETVTKVPVQRQLKMEFGFRTLEAASRSSYASPSPQTKAESLMLTGDLNVAVVEWIVQYRIKDPRAWLFHVRDVDETFRYMSEAAMRQVVGDHSCLLYTSDAADERS